jgi:HEPN domain-containing protein
MPNQTYAKEWLDRAKRNLDTAVLLFNHNHYTDVIAIDIHQTLEKAFKSVYAYHGISIPRTHNLLPLFEFVRNKISIEDVNVDDIRFSFLVSRLETPGISHHKRKTINDKLPSSAETLVN